MPANIVALDSVIMIYDDGFSKSPIAPLYWHVGYSPKLSTVWDWELEDACRKDLQNIKQWLFAAIKY